MPIRRTKRTRYPGIYEVVGGKKTAYKVSYRVSGLGQRTKTKASSEEALISQGTVRTPAGKQHTKTIRSVTLPEPLVNELPADLERYGARGVA